MGKGLTSAVVGTGTGLSVSTAPNVTGATVNVSYVPNGFAPQSVIFSGLFDLPTTGKALIDHVVIVGTDPNNNSFPVATIQQAKQTSGVWGTTATYSNANSTTINQPTAAQTWSFTFTCFDKNNLQTGTPYPVTGIVVSPAGLSLTSFTEVGPRTADQSASVSSTFSIVPVVSGAQLPMWVTVRVDYDNGEGPQQLGQTYLTTVGQAITWQCFVPTSTSQTAWVCYVCVGAITDTQTLPSGYQTASLTVPACGACLSTDVTNAGLVPNAAGQTVQYSVFGAGGYQNFTFTVRWTQPTSDVNYWFSNLCFQMGYAQNGTGTVASGNILSASGSSFTASQVGYIIEINGAINFISGYTSPTTVTLQNPVSNGSVTWQVWNPSPTNNGVVDAATGPAGYFGQQIADSGTIEGGFSVAGTTVTTVPGTWGIPPQFVPGTATVNPYITYRFWIFAFSRQGTTAAGGSGTAVLQTGCFNGADHLDITPTTAGTNYTANAVDLTQTNTNTVAPQMGFNGGGQLGNLGIQVLLSLPSLGPSTFYPQGAIIQLSPSAGANANAFFKNIAASTSPYNWVSTQDPAQLLAGAAAAGVTVAYNQITAVSLVTSFLATGYMSANQVDTGTLDVGGPGNAGQIYAYNGSSALTAALGYMPASLFSGGPFYGLWAGAAWFGGNGPGSGALISLNGTSGAITGCSMQLVGNGVTTTTNNSEMTGTGEYAGLSVSDGIRVSYVTPEGFVVINSSGTETFARLDQGGADNRGTLTLGTAGGVNMVLRAMASLDSTAGASAGYIEIQFNGTWYKIQLLAF